MLPRGIRWNKFQKNEKETWKGFNNIDLNAFGAEIYNSCKFIYYVFQDRFTIFLIQSLEGNVANFSILSVKQDSSSFPTCTSIIL